MATGSEARPPAPRQLAAVAPQSLAGGSDALLRQALSRTGVRCAPRPRPDAGQRPRRSGCRSSGSGPAPRGASRRARTSSGPSAARHSRAHAREHSLETQPPFIRQVLSVARWSPWSSAMPPPTRWPRSWTRSGAGPRPPSSSARICPTSVPTAFRPDRQARRLDGEGLGPHNACGFLPIAGLLGDARRRAGRGQTLALRTSADAEGG